MDNHASNLEFQQLTNDFDALELFCNDTYISQGPTAELANDVDFDTLFRNDTHISQGSTVEVLTSKSISLPLDQWWLEIMAAGASVQLPPSFASGPTGPIQIVIPSDKPQRTQALPLGSRRRQPRTKTLEQLIKTNALALAGAVIHRVEGRRADGVIFHTDKYELPCMGTHVSSAPSPDWMLSANHTNNAAFINAVMNKVEEVLADNGLNHTHDHIESRVKQYFKTLKLRYKEQWPE